MLVVRDCAIGEAELGSRDGLVGVLGGDLFIEVDTKSRTIGEFGEAFAGADCAALEQILNPGEAGRVELLDCRRGGGGVDVERGEGGDFALRIVRRHFDAVGFGDDADLFHFEDAAGVADVWLDEIDEVAGAEF